MFLASKTYVLNFETKYFSEVLRPSESHLVLVALDVSFKMRHLSFYDSRVIISGTLQFLSRIVMTKYTFNVETLEKT
jgi:hypothetical protein